jgi:type II secretory pathway pseudopilin PulG
MINRLEDRPRRTGHRSALTLLELVVVIAILAALAGMAVPLYDNTNSQSQAGATNESLRRLQTLILNTYAPNMKGADISYGGWSLYGLSNIPINLDGLPRGLTTSGVLSQPSLLWLFQNPASVCGTVAALAPSFSYTTHLGWNGPYLMSGIGVYPGQSASAVSNGFNATYGNAGDPTVLDGWGNPIVIAYVHDPNQQAPYRYYFVLLSAGPNQSLTSFSETGTGTPALTVSVPAANGEGITVSYLSPDNGTTRYYHWLPLVYYQYNQSL